MKKNENVRADVVLVRWLFSLTIHIFSRITRNLKESYIKNDSLRLNFFLLCHQPLSHLPPYFEHMREHEMKAVQLWRGCEDSRVGEKKLKGKYQILESRGGVMSSKRRISMVKTGVGMMMAMEKHFVDDNENFMSFQIRSWSGRVKKGGRYWKMKIEFHVTFSAKEERNEVTNVVTKRRVDDGKIQLETFLPPCEWDECDKVSCLLPCNFYYLQLTSFRLGWIESFLIQRGCKAQSWENYQLSESISVCCAMCAMCRWLFMLAEAGVEMSTIS